MIVFSITEELGKYLVIPLLHQRIAKHIYSYLFENMHQKLASQNTNNLSLARRITFCKSVLSMIPLYPTQSFLIPKSICMEIEKIYLRFIWVDNKGGNKVHLINQNVIYQPKLKGGLGLRKIHSMNKTFIMKLGWGHYT